jgi:hypothetical protein
MVDAGVKQEGLKVIKMGAADRPVSSIAGASIFAWVILQVLVVQSEQ